MTELVVCPACRRHVGVGEVTCPFCASALPVQRAHRFMPAGRITRAAVFSAALVACESKSSEPKPAPVPQQGSDDLEDLLDSDRHVDRPAPADAASADAVEAIATAVDAGVAADAGVDPQVAERKRREAAERRERRRQQLELERQRRDMERHHMNKPYGAPPARRRIV